MVKKITDLDIRGIKTPEEAKNYPDYNGKPLEDSKKPIFDSALFKNPDGTFKVDDIRNAVALLANLTEANDNLPDEKLFDPKTKTTNLTDNGNDLLITFLEARRNNTTAFRAVEENKAGQVDNIITEYQALQFKRINRKLEVEKKSVLTSLTGILERGVKQDREIEKARKERDKHPVAEAQAYKNKVQAIVRILKDDITFTPGAVPPIGYTLLNSIVKIQERSCKIGYNVSSSEPNSLGSIIKTAISSDYSDAPYTHPTYLGEGLPFQMKRLFEQFDKDKLFAIIDKKFVSTPAEAKKIKTAFERVINVAVKTSSVDKSLVGGDYAMSVLYPVEDPNIKLYGRSELLIPSSLEEAHEYALNISDIFIFMNAFFPQGTTDFSNIDCLKADDANALPFSGTNKLTTEHDIIWRGRNDPLTGKRYRDLGGASAFPRHNAFPSKHLQLSWSGLKGKSIPKFFWEVYDNPKATQFTSKKSLDKNGRDITLYDGEISVYENELETWRMGTGPDYLMMAYQERVKDIMNGLITVNGRKVADADKLDPKINWTDFEETYYNVIGAAFETFHTFRQREERKTYAELKADNLIVPYMIENTNSSIDNNVVSIWDEMDGICDGKIGDAETYRNKLSAELNKRLVINAEENVERTKLAQINDKIKKIEEGKIAQLKVQLDHLGAKVADPTNLGAITSQEALALYSLCSLMEELEGSLAPKYQTYRNNLAALQKKRSGVMGSYGDWKRMGNDFEERLNSFKKNEGKNLSEAAIKAYFAVVSLDLKAGEKLLGLSPEEKVELTVITNYLNEKPKLRKDELSVILNVDIDLSDDLVEKWRKYGDKKLFEEEGSKIKEIADVVNNLSDKSPFFTELKAYLTGKSDVPPFPSDTDDEQDKLNYLAKLDPEYFIGSVSTYQIKHDDKVKDDIKKEMEAAKNSDDKGLDMTKYGDGTKITDDGMINYFSEKRGGINHSYAKVGAPENHDGKETSILTKILSYGYYAPVWGTISIAVILLYIYRASISAWWNGPAEEEGKLGDAEKDEDE